MGTGVIGLGLSPKIYHLFWSISHRALRVHIELHQKEEMIPSVGGKVRRSEQVAIPPFALTTSSIQLMWLETLV